MNEFLLYLGSALTLIWGITHLFPTRSVVSGFGEISADNRHIITMEWITEGVALIFIGALVATVTFVEARSAAAVAAASLSAVALLALAVVSLFTGYQVNFLPFKLCPYIFGASALLFLAGAYL